MQNKQFRRETRFGDLSDEVAAGSFMRCSVPQRFRVLAALKGGGGGYLLKASGTLREEHGSEPACPPCGVCAHGRQWDPGKSGRGHLSQRVGDFVHPMDPGDDEASVGYDV